MQFWNETEIKRKGVTISDEHGTFTPLVFTMNGFMGVELTMYHKQLSSKKISEKGDEKY